MVAELSLYMLEEPEVLWDPQENKSVKELGGQAACAGHPAGFDPVTHGRTCVIWDMNQNAKAESIM